MEIILAVFGVIFLIIGAYYILNTLRLKTIAKGRDYEKSGDYQQAIEQYEKALSSQTDEEVLWRLANINEKIGKRGAAIARLKELLKKRKFPVDVKEYDVRYKLGSLLFQNQKDEEAFETFLNIYKDNQKDPNILKFLIIITLGQRRCDVALKLLNQFLAIDDQEPNTFFLLGICFYEHGQYFQAKKMFIEASKRDRNDDWRYKFLEGVTHFYTEEYQEVINALENIRKSPIPIPYILEIIYQLLAHSYYYLKQYKDAEKMISEAKAVMSKIKPDSNLHSIEEDLLAITIKDNNFDEANETLNRLIKIEPDSFRWNALSDNFKEISSKVYGNIKEEPILDEYGMEDKQSQLKEWLKKDTNKEKAESLELEELDLQYYFTGFLDYWENKDLLGDTVWKLSNLTREGQFDLNKYFDVQLLTGDNVKENNTKDEIKSFNRLKKDQLLKISRQIIQRLNFEVIEENFHIDNDSHLHGDGIDYIATIKGNAVKDKLVIHIRQWDSDSIGIMVLKELEDAVKEAKAKQGIFITSGMLSDEAMSYTETTNKINVIQGKQFRLLLEGVQINNK